MPSETFRGQLFSEGHDSDGTTMKHKCASKELHESENCNSVRVGQDGAGNAVVPIVVVEQEFMLISDEDIAKLKIDSLHAEIKKRSLGRKGLNAELTTRAKKDLKEKVIMQNTPESEISNASVTAEGAH